MSKKDPPDSIPQKFPVLPNESVEEFERNRDAYNEEIKPRGVIEQQVLDESIALGWENQRYNRAKTNLIISEFPRALKNLLRRYGAGSGHAALPSNLEADKLARDWFANESGKQRVLEQLKRFNLD